MSLAIDSYRSLDSLSDEDGVLNLGWTLGERALLSIDLGSVLSRALEAEVENGLVDCNRYAVKDPYGDESLSPAVSSYFSSIRLIPVTCGAGVISLLQSLAALVSLGRVCIVGEVYPDFPHWVTAHRGECVFARTALEARDVLESTKISVAFLERPNLTGNSFDDLTELEGLCRMAQDARALVIVDESNANYYPPSYSAARLLSDVDNLAVLRGFSKAYSLGGLRLAYCMTSVALTDRVRSVVPPLLASSLSITLGRCVLQLGDIALRLRDAIVNGKGTMYTLLKDAGLEGVVLSSTYLPYFFIVNRPEYVQSRVVSKGVVGKRHPVWAGSCTKDLYRLSVPLTSTRMALLKEKLTSRMK